jgi:hypothetical protein
VGQAFEWESMWAIPTQATILIFCMA